MKTQDLWLPRIQTTLVEEINRRAAATGSVTYAMQTAHADYNGHYVRVWYNDYKGYWIAEYHWGGRVVIARGTAKECLLAGHDYYKRGAKGATVVACALAEEDAAYAKMLGFEPHSRDIESANYNDDPRKGMINEAFMYEKHFGGGVIGILANSATVEEYKAKIYEYFKSKKGGK
jgi:hypothetical protein